MGDSFVLYSRAWTRTRIIRVEVVLGGFVRQSFSILEIEQGVMFNHGDNSSCICWIVEISDGVHTIFTQVLHDFFLERLQVAIPGVLLHLESINLLYRRTIAETELRISRLIQSMRYSN